MYSSATFLYLSGTRNNGGSLVFQFFQCSALLPSVPIEKVISGASCFCVSTYTHQPSGSPLFVVNGADLTIAKIESTFSLEIVLGVSIAFDIVVLFFFVVSPSVLLLHETRIKLKHKPRNV